MTISPEERAALRKRHHLNPGHGWCDYCDDNTWPCDAILCLDALEAAEQRSACSLCLASLEAAEQQVAELEEVMRKLVVDNVLREETNE